MLHNKNLRWQKNRNAEIGIDLNVARTKISLVGYFNRTKLPYKYTNTYTPFSYNMLQLPEGFNMPAHPQMNVDHQTGMVYIRDNESDYWTPMDVHVTDQTFVRSTSPDNGADVIRRGAELIVDFPEITPIRTQIRVDAAYTYTKYIDNSLSYYYQNGWSHTSLANRSYQICRYLCQWRQFIDNRQRQAHPLAGCKYYRHYPYPESTADYIMQTGSLTREAFAEHLRI